MARNLRVGVQRGLRQSIGGGLGTGDIFTLSPASFDFARTGTKDKRITFSRASSATYVGADGLIKTTPVNLLTNSEKIDAWSKVNMTVTANATTAPDGSTTADKIVGSSGSSIKRVFRGGYGSGTFAASVYLKAAEYDYGYVGIYDGTTVYESVLVNLTNGSFLKFSGNSVTYSINSVGNGWYRVSTTLTSSNAYINVGLSDVADPSVAAGGHFNATGDGTSGIFVWGGQLEEGSTATDYIPTTSTKSGAPRFDHDPATNESLGLLIEEARTNSEQYSQGFTSGWSLSYAQTTTGQSDPMGGTDAILVKQTNGTSTRQFIASSTGLNFGSNAYTVSVFVKYVNYDYVIFTGRDQDGPDSRIGYLLPKLRFQFSTETIAFQESTWGGTETLDYGFEKYSNGWYRLWMTRNISARTNRWGIAVQSDYAVGVNDLNFVTGDNSSSVLAFGFQAEQGSFPTSYIPTSGSAVTRAADVAEITGTNFSDFYNQSEGTLFAEVNPVNTTQGGVWGPINSSGTDISEGFAMQGSTAQLRCINYLDSGSTSNDIVFNSPSAGSNKLAVAGSISDDTTGAYFDGSTGTVNASRAQGYENVAGARIGVRSNQRMTGHIKRLSYFSTRLDDATLESITS